MERYKFRALKDDHSNCNWIYGSIVYSNIIPRISNDEGLTFHTCIKGTEGQYTGLKDKNGKEIYEGDKYQVAKNKIYEVRFMQSGESNHEWYGGCFVLYLAEQTFFPFDEYAMKHGEVVGNIYELLTNPL